MAVPLPSQSDGWFDVKVYPRIESWEHQGTDIIWIEQVISLPDALDSANCEDFDEAYPVQVIAYGTHKEYENGEDVYHRFNREESSAPTT